MIMSEKRPAKSDPEPGHDDDPEARLTWPILLAVIAFLALWGVCVALWGVPGLYIPALVTVPVIWVVLILVSRG